MLSPDHNRASLDLVMFHPWLKSHTIIIPSSSPKLKITSQEPIIIHNREISSSSSSSQPNNDKNIHDNNVHHHIQSHPFSSSRQLENRSLPLNNIIQLKKKKKKSFKKKLKKVMVFIIEGPYPPPKRPYHELSRLSPSSS